jgi:hypothetical protein
VVASIEETEVEFRLKEKLDSNAIIQDLRFKPHEYGHMRIPLCRMTPLPLVRPILQPDVLRLEAEFMHGYKDGDRVFYVSITNDRGCQMELTDEINKSWDPHWMIVNDEFKAILSKNEDLVSLHSMMFFVWDGNHRQVAWTNHISRLHRDDLSWHFFVDSILLVSKDIRARL